MKISKSTFPVILAVTVALLVCGACSRDRVIQPEPTPEPTPNPSPAMPLPGTTAEGVEPPKTASVENPFTVAVHNCYLVDPDINPIGAPQSREKGIRMVVSGAIRNNSDHILYRAGVFSKLVVNFGTDVSFEKYSPGLGFEPAVTSTDPWRPATWRNFRIEGRAFDPIYREFKPKTITGILTLEAKDPLNFRFNDEIARMKPRWETLFGISTDFNTTLAEDVSIAYGPKAQKKAQPRGTPVRLVAQQGGAYLSIVNGDYFGWVPEKSVVIRQYEGIYPEKSEVAFPMTGVVDGRYEVRLIDYRYDVSVDGLPESPGGYMAFHVGVRCLAQHQSLPVRPEYFWVDQGSGRLAEGTPKAATLPGALPALTNLKPQEDVDGWVYVPRHKDGWPFAVVFDPPGGPASLSWIVFPAIGNDGVRKTTKDSP